MGRDRRIAIAHVSKYIELLATPPVDARRYGQHLNHIQEGGRMKLVYMTEILNINYVFD